MDDPCWDGYEQIGMKEKDGKQVPNCVPKSTEGGLGSGRNGHMPWMKEITELKTNKHKMGEEDMDMSEFANKNHMCKNCMNKAFASLNANEGGMPNSTPEHRFEDEWEHDKFAVMDKTGNTILTTWDENTALMQAEYESGDVYGLNQDGTKGELFASFEAKASEAVQDWWDSNSLTEKSRILYNNNVDPNYYDMDTIQQSFNSMPSSVLRDIIIGIYMEEKGMQYDDDIVSSFVQRESKATEEGINDWWDRVSNDGGDIDRMFSGWDFNELPEKDQNHYFSLYMEELGQDKYGDHMEFFPDQFDDTYYKKDPSLGKYEDLGGWKINEPTDNTWDGAPKSPYPFVENPLANNESKEIGELDEDKEESKIAKALLDELDKELDSESLASEMGASFDTAPYVEEIETDKYDDYYGDFRIGVKCKLCGESFMDISSGRDTADQAIIGHIFQAHQNEIQADDITTWSPSGVDPSPSGGFVQNVWESIASEDTSDSSAFFTQNFNLVPTEGAGIAVCKHCGYNLDLEKFDSTVLQEHLRLDHGIAESKAKEDALNPDSKLDTFSTPFLEEEDRFRNDMDRQKPDMESKAKERVPEEVLDYVQKLDDPEWVNHGFMPSVFDIGNLSPSGVTGSGADSRHPDIGQSQADLMEDAILYGLVEDTNHPEREQYTDADMGGNWQYGTKLTPTGYDQLQKHKDGAIWESKASEGDSFKCHICGFKTSDDDKFQYHMEDHDEGSALVDDFMKYEM